MVASIGAVASPSQGVSYYERDGYYANDDPGHREASRWAGDGAADLGLSGAVDPEVFSQVLEGRVPDGSGQRLGRRTKDGGVLHRPGRDVTLSAPKSVSLAALIGGDGRIFKAHDRAVKRTLSWVERHAAQTRVRDPATGAMKRIGGQKMVAATFRHDTSRNLDPQLHTHAVIANMVRGDDNKWRTMANESLYRSQKLIGMIYRAELAAGLQVLGYGIEKSHADGRFEIAGVSRDVIEAFSTRRAAIQAAMNERGLGETADNPRLAERAALMTRAHKRDVDHAALREHWQKQAEALGFDANDLTAEAIKRAGELFRPPPGKKEHDRDEAHARGNGQAELPLFNEGEAIVVAGVARTPGSGDSTRAVESTGAADLSRATNVPPAGVARAAAEWAVAHLSEREAVFSRTDLLTAALAWRPGAVSIGEAEQTVSGLEKDGTLHASNIPVPGDSLTTDKAVADELETIGLMEKGQGASRPVMRKWRAGRLLHRGRLTFGQKEAVKLILSSKDRVVGVQGYAGTGKTTMLDRARVLAGKNGYRLMGLAPSASAAKTLGEEAGIESETLQRFLARNAGVAEGRLTRQGARDMRKAFKKTVLVVDEGSLASTVQARNLLRIANKLRIPRVVVVGDEKQLDAVDAGKPFSQLQTAGMKTARMDEIMRQRDEKLKEAVRASLSGDVKKAFEKLGGRVAEANPENLAGAAAARWLRLSPEARESTGLMAPSHVLREQINGYIREYLAREGTLRGPKLNQERLVSRGYTKAEMALAANYTAGDTVAFHRPYKSLGVEKGEERRVAGVDQETGTVNLESPDGETVGWRPQRVGAKRGAVEVYRDAAIELRGGDRIRWTRNHSGLGLVNSHTAEVVTVGKTEVQFRLEDGRSLKLGTDHSQLRHLDHAWASTVHSFQGRTVDNVIAVMEASHPHLTTQKSFYVEISRARYSAELVTDDRNALREHLEAATGERVAALEGIGAMIKGESGTQKTMETEKETAPVARVKEDGSEPIQPEKGLEEKRVEMDLQL